VIRQAEADHDNAAAQFRAHRRLCGQCSAAARLGRWASCCDQGWMHVKYERMTAAQLRATIVDFERLAPVQGTLF
jgi:hypothetical protein